MLDEVGLERKELSRLLSTAQNEDRRDMIKRAMQVLDGHEKALSGSADKYNIQAINPNIHASVYLASNIPSVESMNPSKMRPASARRRPSMPNLLDSIPEIIASSRNNTGKDDDMMVLPYEDIAEVIPSSSDSRFPVKGIFKANTTTSSNSTSSPLHLGLSSSQSLIHQSSQSHNLGFRGSRSYWMSTGLVPQFILISFYEKWLIRKVEVKAIEVDRLALHVNYSASSTFSSAKLIDMDRDSQGRFTWSIESKSSDDGGLSGIGITLVILQTSGCFCGVSQVKIMVTPHS